MENYFLQDIGLISVLLFVGFFIRFYLKILQRLFIPVSIIAGLLALGLGKSGFDLIPFSENIGTYPGVMIAFLFGALPLTFEIKKNSSQRFKEDTIEIGALTLIILLSQWALGLMFSLTILSWLFPDINSAFGSLLAAGFFGGHGTAAAISDSFSTHLLWDEAATLAMTSATVGIFAATIGGIMWVQWGVRSKETAFLTKFTELPESMRTGLVKKELQESIGRSTFSNISIDPLLMHLLIVLLIGITGIYLSDFIKGLTGGFSIAGFTLAFLVGMIFKGILQKLRLLDYFDPQLISRICGAFADLIVVFGIASIKIAVVIKYAMPLLLLFTFGIFLGVFTFSQMGPRRFSNFWFEKSLFLWGMSLGVTAMGIALLRMVDPEGKSETLPTFAIGYLGVTPFEVACLAFFPLLASHGLTWVFISCSLLVILALWIYLKNKRSAPD